MIILDTNVLSALMQSTPDLLVVSWLDRQPPESVWLTSITLFEAHIGIELLQAGRRRLALQSALKSFLEEDLENRVLAFDQAAAEIAATLAADRQKNGRPIDFRDTQIAAIVLARKAKLATRNVRHFEDLGAVLIDPWIATA